MINSLHLIGERYGASEILHVGAHFAQEADLYHDLGFGPVVWVEAHASLAEIAKANVSRFPEDKVIQAVMWKRSGVRRNLSFTNNSGQSSSLRPMKLHRNLWPDVTEVVSTEVFTTTVDELQPMFPGRISLLVLDVQGCEYEVLRGATNVLDTHVDAVFAEVSLLKLYKGQKLANSVDSLLRQKGFFLHSFKIVNSHFHGNALWLKSPRHASDPDLRFEFTQQKVRIWASRFVAETFYRSRILPLIHLFFAGMRKIRRLLENR